MNFRNGDEAYLVLSDDFEQTVADEADWKPNQILLRKIRRLRSEGVKRLRCRIFRANHQERQAWIICRQLDATEKDPINVDFFDLEPLRQESTHYAID